MGPKGVSASAISFFVKCWGMSHTRSDFMLFSVVLRVGAILIVMPLFSAMDWLYASLASLALPKMAARVGTPIGFSFLTWRREGNELNFFFRYRIFPRRSVPGTVSSSK
jgi:hypothetical protein